MSANSVISEKARIGKNVTIGPFCVIHDDVVIGDNTTLHSHVVVYDGARIGNNCNIFPGAVISAIPQDLKYKGEQTTAEIGDNCIIREFVTINKGTVAAGKTAMGNNNLLMAYVHIAHDCLLGNNNILANGVTLAGHVVIDDFAIVGGLSAIHQFVHIGSHVIISGGSLVRKDVTPFIKAAHEPLAFAGINSVGLRRRGFSNESINMVQDMYRLVFTKGLPASKACEAIESEIPHSPERDLIVGFIRSSTRGILKSGKESAEEEE